jgi:hypothetical protein
MLQWPVLDQIRKAVFGEKGVFGSVTDFVNTRWPPDMTPQQKAEIEKALRDFEAQQEERRQNFAMTMEALTNQAEAQFNERTKELEGTAEDLKTIPILGHMIIFVRGALRPAWCVAAMYFDWQIFTGAWGAKLVAVDPGGGVRITPEGFILIIINFLVLGFIFGERTLRNVVPAMLPIVELIWGRRQEANK